MRVDAQWGAARVQRAPVVAATDAKDDAAAVEDVNGGEVLCQPQRMPHRSDIEAATNLDVFRSVREVQCHKDDVGNAFSAFALEVMLGHPETVVAKATAAGPACDHLDSVCKGLLSTKRGMTGGGVSRIVYRVGL